MSTHHAALSQALSKRLKAESAPAPRRAVYTMSTETRVYGIETGERVRVPKMTAVLASTNLVVGVRQVLGHFESAEQAILFGVTGGIRYGAITLNEILTFRSQCRSGFFRQLNEAEIEHLLSAHRLVYQMNREKFEITISRVERDGEFEVEVESPGILTIATGRKFR